MVFHQVLFNAFTPRLTKLAIIAES